MSIFLENKIRYMCLYICPVDQENSPWTRTYSNNKCSYIQIGEKLLPWRLYCRKFYGKRSKMRLNYPNILCIYRQKKHGTYSSIPAMQRPSIEFVSFACQLQVTPTNCCFKLRFTCQRWGLGTMLHVSDG